MTVPRCAVLILNYNGRQHLDQCLPSALAAASASSTPSQVVVVDNQSTDPDVEHVRTTFPDVEVTISERNDYLFSLNDAVAARTEDFVVLLNNDLRLDQNCIEELLAPLRTDDGLFATSALVRDWDGPRIQFGLSRLDIRRSWYSVRREKAAGDAGPTFYAAGGAAAYRRSAFVELGGFDRLFFPAFYEEVDLSYRAWRRGWRIEHRSSAGVEHRLSATLSSQRTADQWRRVIARNQALFNLKDCGDGQTRAKVLATFPARVVRAMANSDQPAANGLRDALLKAGAALRSRRLRVLAGDFHLLESALDPKVVVRR